MLKSLFTALVLRSSLKLSKLPTIQVTIAVEYREKVVPKLSAFSTLTKQCVSFRNRGVWTDETTMCEYYLGKLQIYHRLYIMLTEHGGRTYNLDYLLLFRWKSGLSVWVAFAHISRITLIQFSSLEDVLSFFPVNLLVDGRHKKLISHCYMTPLVDALCSAYTPSDMHFTFYFAQAFVLAA